jgi:hypothetical protein
MDFNDATMKRDIFAGAMVIVAALLLVMSFVAVFSSAWAEPFFVYRRDDVVAFVGGAGALITLWLVWSISLVAAVFARAFKPWALLGLLIAAVAIFYMVVPSMSGYLDDLEVMLGVREFTS